MKKLLYLLILAPFTGLGQVATFYVDTLALQNRDGNGKNVNEYLAEMEWKINGKHISYKSGRVEVAVNPGKPDTLFYRQRSDSKWDTILCTVREAGEYKFMYNHCCGGFDVADNKGRTIQGNVYFRIEGKPAGKKTYLGTLGEAGIMVSDDKSDVLAPGCRSAMSPNIYQVTLSEIERCRDTTGCAEEICLYEKEEPELIYGFGYKTLSNKLNILFMPLSEEPLQVVYDPQKDEIVIR